MVRRQGSKVEITIVLNRRFWEEYRNDCETKAHTLKCDVLQSPSIIWSIISGEKEGSR